MKGPGSAINWRAASTCSYPFYSNTPLFRPTNGSVEKQLERLYLGHNNQTVG